MANEKLNILRLLIENQEKRYSIRKLSQLRSINYKSAYNAVMQLEKEDIITLERLGNNTNCSFNQKFNPTVYFAEHARKTELIKNKDLKIVYQTLTKLEFQLIALLFGSHAKKSAKNHSDIDLLIITEEKHEEKIQTALSLIPLDIHPTIMGYEDFISMAKSKEFTAVSEAMKNNIILVGIEEYYRLLENAR
ncbi:MAG: nucleotidyltransferase domain-containing protein [archaeon]